jgi:hypothetical protein
VPYIGNDLQVAFPTYKNIDDISGSFNSVTTSFPLRVNGTAPVPLPINSQQCLISVGGVVQRPDDSGTEGFRLSGGNIIFASAPTTGADFFGVILAGADYVNVGASFPNGSAAAPSITFDSDPDTGIYNSAANEIGFTTGGSLKFSISSAGQLLNNTGTAGSPSYTFTGDSNTGIYSPGVDQVALSTGGTGRLFIDSTGRLLVGTSSARVNTFGGNVAPQIQLEGTNGATSSLFLASNRANTGQAFLVFGKSRSVATGGNDAVIADDILGTVSFQGADGTNLIEGARIESFVDGTPGTNDMPGRLTFSTTADGASTPTERMRIDSTGRVLVGVTTTSITATSLLLQGTPATTYSLLRMTSTSSSPADGVELGMIVFGDSGHTNASNIRCQRDGGTWTSGVSQPTRITFSTTFDGSATAVERARITSAGGVQTYSVSGVEAFSPRSNSAAGTSVALLVGRYSATSISDGTNSIIIWTNGNVQNTNNSYTAISDIKLKENIINANSQWNDIKALQVRNYNFKEGQTHRQIGLIAQEVEPISPGLVYESPDRDKDGNNLGTVTKSVNYSVLYMKAVKALQEAMERIEVLEAKIAALENG